jgi:hypothetical protein
MSSARWLRGSEAGRRATIGRGEDRIERPRVERGLSIV